MSPPNPPPKKPVKEEPVEGIDLDDFDEDERKVAGLDPEEAPAKAAVPAPSPPPPAPPTARTAAPRVQELPETESSALSSQAFRATKLAAPPSAPAAPPPAPKVSPNIRDLPEADASALARTQTRPASSAPRPQPAAPVLAARPVPVPKPVVPPVEPIAEPAPEPTQPTVPPAPPEAPAIAPRPVPIPSMPPPPSPPTTPPLPPPPGAAMPSPMPSPQAVPGYAYPPYPGYPTPFQVFQPYQPGSPYGQPPVIYSAPAQRPRASETAEGLLRLNAAALLATGYFGLLALHHTFEATTGVTDAPGIRTQATLGLQFISYFLVVIEAILIGLAVAAGASALFRLRESRAELIEKPPEFPKRSLKLLALAIVLPLTVGIASWYYLSEVARSMPGSGAGSDLGLARLFTAYGYAAFAVAASQIVSSFLVVLGLKGALAHLAPLAPRKPLRQFATGLVLASAVNAATVLVLNFVVLAAPTVGRAPSASPILFLLLIGPAIGCLAGLRLRAYTRAAGAEAEKRFKEKLAREKAA